MNLALYEHTATKEAFSWHSSQRAGSSDVEFFLPTRDVELTKAVRYDLRSFRCCVQ